MFNLPAIVAQLPLMLAESAPTPWRPASWFEALAATIAFALVGLALAIAGYKLFDACTPAISTRRSSRTAIPQRP